MALPGFTIETHLLRPGFVSKVSTRLLSFLFALWPVAAFFKWWLVRRRIRPGHCRHCSYNLTGNISGVCPECGTRIGIPRAETKTRELPGGE